MQKRILGAMASRLAAAPEQYGDPLRRQLRGYHKLRVGDYRIVYRIVGHEVWVLGVGHRRSIYDWIRNRLAWEPAVSSEHG